MRPAGRRISKYSDKIDSDVIKQRYDSQKGSAVKKQTAVFAEQAELQQKVKGLVNSIPSIFQHYYIAYAEEFEKQKAYTERLIIFNKWRARGLDIDTLIEISENLFNWLPPYTWVWDINSSWDVDRWW